MTAEWELDLEHRKLRSREEEVPLKGRALEIVEALVQAEGELVTKDALMAQVWPKAVVNDNRLQVHISAIRRALGVDRSLLQTDSGRGYRLLGPWRIRPRCSVHDMREPAIEVQAIEAVPPSDLPAATVALFGRSRAVRLLRDALSIYRVVTLTGPGGIGKTAMALEVVRDLFPGFQGKGGVVELGPLADPELLPSTVAAALGISLDGEGATAAAVARQLGDKKLILVLDNCEHVIDGAAALAETIVHLCPNTTILATSREALRIDGEFIYRVPPLDVPPVGTAATDELLSCSAVQLFVARTRALGLEFVPDTESLATIVTICRHLDGIPLAIEFAAGRAAALGVEPVLAGMADRFALLTGGSRTALPRQQTLRATFDWSYDLLCDAEQRVLRRLAIFPGGFTLAAAAAVSNQGDVAATAEIIAGLASKSLLDRCRSAPAGEWRLLDTTRAYALEKLSESGEGTETVRQHAEYLRELGALAKVPGS